MKTKLYLFIDSSLENLKRLSVRLTSSADPACAAAIATRFPASTAREGAPEASPSASAVEDDCSPSGASSADRKAGSSGCSSAC